ncbi:type IV pilus secretin (or competence protein) PilQ [Malonomonas rubra DSM 5091]|uniref:Type IV pilus secretin (Or competence protein) PilQ n=1 Tax=Malonomonas rubra DSM 5091 TaxID=1122189 RepID=A0A1M6D6Y1_MALRU|nr:type IV pilus secretin family protein [Malonomonas rubra]SHI68949.1 type IV pilus secretin (or competence protein) PilQ [Malonomonas rubra DSM 5091]
MRRSILRLSVVVLAIVGLLGSVGWAVESLSSVSVDGQRAELTASAGVEKVRYFTLDSPKRLVVDLYGVQPGKHSRRYPLSEGFKALRVGPYEDKTRFVFDVDGGVFPTFNVNTENEQVVVTWQPTQKVAEQVKSEPATMGSAKVTAIDFSNDSGQSKFLISLDGLSTASELVREDNKITFSLKNATLPRALRRVFDTLAFPSAINSVTPYLVNVSGKPEVRFSVFLKGDVPYRLEKAVSGYEFIVSDGRFAAADPIVTGIMPLPVDGTQPTYQPSMTGEVSASAANAMPVPVFEDVVSESGKQYTGAKTSLVFDNADVKDILRLIAEISELNIIASDDVKGNVTLRLIDVPWDQALELVLDITNLGMLQEGNVVRVLPKDKIRGMKEAELTSLKSQEKLEPLETEVIIVSYADLASVQAPVEKILSDRGTITPDNRNKLLIVNDIPSRIEKVKELIAILDTPERQVMIEARIVEVSTEYSHDLGVNWGVSYDNDPGGTSENVAGGIGLGGDFLLGTSLGTSGVGAGITFGNSVLNSTILDMRISALEAGSKLKVISTPRVTTLNGQSATIKQGTELPYQTVEDGEVSIEYKEVVLAGR